MRRDVLFLLVVLAAGCGQPPAGPGAAAPVDPVRVRVVRPLPQTIRRIIEQPGAVHAYEEAQLYARIPGYVRRLHADIGQVVKGPRLDAAGKEVAPGDLLVELSVPEVEEEGRQKEAMVVRASAAVEQAVKALAAAEAHVHTCEAAVDEARAGLGRAKAMYDRWSSEYSRMADLVKRGVIDAQGRDEVQNQFRAAGAGREEATARVASAEAAVRKSKADRDKAKADIAAAEAQREVCRADARRLQALLGYARLRAPFDGIITRRRISTGDFVQPSTGKPVGVFTVVRLDPVRIAVDVPEADAALVRQGMEVALTIPALRPPQRSGKISRTSWALEPGARTLQAEIDLPNPDRSLRPGMYVHASFTALVPAGRTLPNAAVARQGDEDVAYRIVDGKAIRTVLRIGLRDSQHVEVLQYRAGATGAWSVPTGQEEFASGNLAELSDGAKVEVQR